jgi:hypothetical protein
MIKIQIRIFLYCRNEIVAVMAVWDFQFRFYGNFSVIIRRRSIFLNNRRLSGRQLSAHKSNYAFDSMLHLKVTEEFWLNYSRCIRWNLTGPRFDIIWQFSSIARPLLFAEGLPRTFLCSLFYVFCREIRDQLASSSCN